MATPTSHAGARARRPGLLRALGTVLSAIVVFVAIAYAFNFWPWSTSPSKGTSSAYGGIPAWIPMTTLPVGRIVQASASRPWLAIEGDTVRVVLAHASVDATAVGPAVPVEGRFPVPATTPCSFNITFTSASGSVPIDPESFTIVDEHDTVHRPGFVIDGSKATSTVIGPNHSVTVTLRDVLPTGNGQLRWAPDGGAPIVSWDFDVEID